MEVIIMLEIFAKIASIGLLIGILLANPEMLNL